MHKTFPFTLAALILILLFALPADERGGLWPLERLLRDWHIQHTLQHEVDGRIMIVDIDDRSLQTVGRWPWDRATIARLLQMLSEEGQAAVVGVDLLFPEASPNDTSLRPLTARHIIFAQSFGAQPHPPIGVAGTGAVLHGVEPPPTLQAQSVVGMTPNLAQHVKLAHITPTFDADGKIRNIKPLLIYQGQAYETLALAMLRDFLDLPPEYTLQRNHNPLASAYWLRDSTQTLQLPLDSQGRLRLPFTTTTQGFLHISAADILEGNLPPDLLAGRLVLVGSSATGLGDLIPTPVDPIYPAVQIHAVLLQALLDRHFIIQPQGTPIILAAILLLMALVLEITLPRISPFLGVTIIALLAALWVGLNHLAWQHGLALP
ncbi:MAG: CHASE2 domain-containing protein, partial [Halothiobacillus sp.]|nr:CHASE2 domain-containing protein [Halothiobacillus sp.]